MSLPQQKFRELVFQMLYCTDVSYSEESEMIDLVMKENKVTRKNALEALNRVKEIQKKKEDLDQIIKKLSKEYTFERIQIIEKNILRLAIFEMSYDENVPAKVAIAEAIRLCRKFSNPESASFVNALLDVELKKGIPDGNFSREF